MRKRTIILVAAFVAALLIIPAGLAFAGEANVSGTGALWARGTGTAVIDGAGHVTMAIDGDVTIVDHAGDAHVVITSRPGDTAESLAADTEYELENFRGIVKVTGSDFTIEAHGRMKFRAAGTGSVYLQGHGTYRTRHLHGRWTPTGVRIDLGAPTPAA